MTPARRTTASPDLLGVLFALASYDSACLWSTDFEHIAAVVRVDKEEIRKGLGALVDMGLLVRRSGVPPFHERGPYSCWYPTPYASENPPAAWDRFNRHPANIALRELYVAVGGTLHDADGRQVRPRDPEQTLEHVGQILDESVTPPVHIDGSSPEIEAFVSQAGDEP